MIGVTPIEYLFSNIKLDEKGSGDESTLARRRPNCSEGDDLNDKKDKSGFGEVKTLIVMYPLLWITRTLIMIIVLWLNVFPCCNP
jgi:hypothetical protein